MLLSDILKGIDFEKSLNFKETEINGVCCDSRCCKKGDIFVCIKGERFDAEDFLYEALENGIEVIVVKDSPKKAISKTVIISKNPRKTLAEISKMLYGKKTDKMKIIGITGTKGKTTTAEFLFSCIKATEKCILVSTLGIKRSDSEDCYIETDNTTPDAAFLYKILSNAYDDGFRAAVIEVSSQALAKFRVYGINFSLCVFTSFSPDHIGASEHKDVNEYLLAKKSLFTNYGCKTAILNYDDTMADYIGEGVEKRVKVSFSESDYRILILESMAARVRFLVNSIPFEISFGGVFNAKNAALALAAAKEICDKDIACFRESIAKTRISGRYELYEQDGKRIIIDFAHNPESFKSILDSAAQITENKLIVVFGAVGGRSLGRRRSMAEIVGERADFIILTSDNPGFESAEKICRELFSYISDKSKVRVIINREEAIKKAYFGMDIGDTLLLLGKGHEQYQYVNGEKIPFSESDIVKGLLF